MSGGQETLELSRCVWGGRGAEAPGGLREGHTPGHLVHSRLGHLVCQCSGPGPESRYAGDIDNAAPTPLETGQGALTELHSRLEVDRHALVDCLHTQLCEAFLGHIDEE